jgi:biopolymer transport protein ExbD
MRHASVTNGSLRSPLREAMTVNPSARGAARKKKIVMTLILTSLVDAFSIMLLYLLVQNTGNGSTLELNKSEKLPTASKAEALHEGTLVRLEGNRYFIGDKSREEAVEEVELAAKLQARKAQLGQGEASDSIIIQADRLSDFSSLTPIIRAGSVSGFHKFKFAVLQGESGSDVGNGSNKL